MDEAPRSYASPRDAVLESMWANGWHLDESGTAESPTGTFARLAVTPQTLHSILESFPAECAALGLHRMNELVGEFVATYRGDVFYVDTYEHAGAAASAFLHLEERYGAWVAAGSPPAEVLSVEARIGRAMFREFRAAVTADAQVGIHNAVAELDKELPGVLREFENALAVA